MWVMMILNVPHQWNSHRFRIDSFRSGTVELEPGLWVRWGGNPVERFPSSCLCGHYRLSLEDTTFERRER